MSKDDEDSAAAAQAQDAPQADPTALYSSGSIAWAAPEAPGEPFSRSSDVVLSGSQSEWSADYTSSIAYEPPIPSGTVPTISLTQTTAAPVPPLPQLGRSTEEGLRDATKYLLDAVRASNLSPQITEQLLSLATRLLALTDLETKARLARDTNPVSQLNPDGTNPSGLLDEPMTERLAKLETILDRLVTDRKEDRDELRAQQLRVETKLEQLRVDITSSEQRIDDRVRNMKGIIVGTAIATVLGIAAFNATVLSNMIASFESGKSTANAINESVKKLDEVQRRLDVAFPAASTPAR